MHMLRTLTLGCLVLAPALGLSADLIDINTADVATLATQIKGVGQARAEAIIAYREKNGPFASVDDLALVQGIGQSTVEANRAILTVGKPVTK